MKYIAILDYLRLDNGMFMKSFSEAMGRQSGCSGIIIHGDSGYTERLIQTGIMREDAILRSTRDLNHRIVALLADSGVSGIGVNGYQKKIVRLTGRDILVDRDWLEVRPPGTHIILSNLAWDDAHQKAAPVPLPVLADALSTQLNRQTVIIFSLNDSGDPVIFKKNSGHDSNSNSKQELLELVPDDLRPLPKNCYLGTTEAFGNLPDKSGLRHFSS